MEHPATTVASSEAHIRIEALSKRYGAVRALGGVSLEIERGTVHAIVGENGAGKSTLGKAISGAVVPDGGRLEVSAAKVSFRSPKDALRHGIVRIAQEISLVPQLTVMQNVFLGSEDRRGGFVQARRMRDRYAELAQDAGFELDPDATVRSLRLADQQKVEILRALARHVDLVVMDEPTAALNRKETESLLEIVGRLRQRGTTVVFVSHFLDEVLRVADRVTVMKDGEIVHTVPAAGQTSETLVTAMLGRTLDTAYPDPPPPPRQDVPPILQVRGLRSLPLVDDVSLDLRPGEILGLAGLVGAGRSEIAHAIFGSRKVTAGTVTLDGRTVRSNDPRAAINAGISLLPESRKDEGLLLNRAIGENVTLASLPKVARSGLVSPRRERDLVTGMLESVGAPAGREREAVGTLSGGNQQKVLFAKWLFPQPRVLIADEPTRGVDVGARRSIYDLIVKLAADGLGVILISSDFEELVALCHRVLAIRHGSVVAELDRPQISEESILAAVFDDVAIRPSEVPS